MLDGMGVDIGREAHLQRNPPLPDVLLKGRIFPDARPVPDALRAAIVQGLPHRLRAVCLTGVAGAVEPVASRVIESRRVVSRRIPQLRSGQIEADHARFAVIHRRVGYVGG